MYLQGIFLPILVIFWLTSHDQDEAPWAFRYPGEGFNEMALLDLCYLNVDFAGQHGWIGFSEDSESFLREDDSGWFTKILRSNMNLF